MIKKYVLVALVAFSFMAGIEVASGDPMTGTVTAIDDDEVAFIHQGSRVLKARYTG